MTEPLKSSIPFNLQVKAVRCIAKEQKGQGQPVVLTITSVIKFYFENAIIIRNFLLIDINTHHIVIISPYTKFLLKSIYQNICFRKYFTLLVRRTITY